VPVSYFSLGFELISDPATEMRDPFYWIHMGVHERDNHWLILDMRYWSLLAAYKAQNLQLIAQGKHPIPFTTAVDDYGWNLEWPQKQHPELISEQAAKQRVHEHHRMMRKEVVPRNQLLIKQMIAECKKHGVKVLIVTTPVCSTYSRAVVPQILDREVKFLNSL